MDTVILYILSIKVPNSTWSIWSLDANISWHVNNPGSTLRFSGVVILALKKAIRSRLIWMANGLLSILYLLF